MQLTYQSCVYDHASLHSELYVIFNMSSFLMDKDQECLVMCVTCTQEDSLPVHMAARNGKLDVVKCLLDLQPDTISVKNNVSWTISTIASPYSTALFLVMRITVLTLCLLLGNITSSIPTRSDSSRLPHDNLFWCILDGARLENSEGSLNQGHDSSIQGSHNYGIWKF